MSAAFTEKQVRAVIGLWLLWQSYPSFPALYAVSIRQTRALLPASFRFHLTMNTLAFGYDLPTAGRSRVFHPLERALAGRTKKSRMPVLSEKHTAFSEFKTQNLTIRGSPEKEQKEAVASLI